MRLDSLAEVQMGYPFRSRVEHDPRGNVSVIQMKDIDDDAQLQPSQTIKVCLPKGKNHHLLRVGDLLFRSRGLSYGAALVPEGIGEAVLAAPMLLIRPHAAVPEYLHWYLNAPATKALLATLAEGTSVRMISTEALKTLEVPLPPAAAQRCIAQTAALAGQEQALLSRIAALRQTMSNHLLMKLAREATQ